MHDAWWLTKFEQWSQYTVPTSHRREGLSIFIFSRVHCLDFWTRNYKALFTEMAPELPIEIFEEIIGYLWNNKSALGVCSLAKNTDYPESKIHLFLCYSTSTVGSFRPSESCLLNGWYFANFLRLLDALSLHISGYVLSSDNWHQKIWNRGVFFVRWQSEVVVGYVTPEDCTESDDSSNDD